MDEVQQDRLGRAFRRPAHHAPFDIIQAALSPGNPEASPDRAGQSRGGGGARTVRLPLCSGPLTTPSRSICSIRRAARL